MNTLDKKYQDLLQDILDNGIQKSDRTGTGTLSVFGRQIRHNMRQGFPILTTKKVAWNSVTSELLWFLTGQTNISFLLKHNNNIWNGDAYKRYERVWNWDLDEPLPIVDFIERIKTDSEFAKIWGELGPIYGKQWRKWDGSNGRIDQIDELIKELKTNPDSRRLMVNAWNVGELDQMVLPPCHYGFQVYTREENGQRYISLMWNQRSVDTFLGLPFNIASYGLLLEIIAKEVNMIPDELIGNLGDVHLYKNHIEQAKEQISREPYDLPKLKMNPIFLANLEHKGFDEAINGQVNFELEGYQSHPAIKAPLSN